MDYEQKKLIYKLYKKGKEKLSSFDKLTIEANPEIKDELNKLFGVEEGFYTECNHKIEEALSGREERKKSKKAPVNKIIPFLTIPVSIAAGLLIIFQLVLNPKTSPIALGSKVSLFITSTAAPDHFYGKGSSFQPGEELQLAFQPPLEVEKIRQGVIFAAGDAAASSIYYRYHSEQDRFNQRERTIVAERLKPAASQEYICFIAYFSVAPFDEQALVDNITDIIRREKAGAEKTLLKKYKTAVMDFVYLKRAE